MDMKVKHFDGCIKAVDEQRRAIRFIISTDEIDRYNEIVTVEAVKNAIPAFGKNAVCLLNHQHRSDSGMPTIPGSWDTSTYQAYKHHSEMDLIFADTDLGETCWKLCKGGHMKAVSIAFKILDGAEEVRKGVRICIITKIELYEISLVAVPACRGAIAKSILKDCGFGDLTEHEDRDKGSLADGLKNHITAQLESLKAELRAAMDEQFEEIKDLLCPGSDKFYDVPDSAGEDDALGKSSGGESEGVDDFTERFNRKCEEINARSRRAESE